MLNIYPKYDYSRYLPFLHPYLTRSAPSADVQSTLVTQTTQHFEMSSWRYEDTDEHRTDGLTRVGYDADTQRYTFASPSGELYQGEPGNRYGKLAKIGHTDPSTLQWQEPNRDNDKRYMYPFFGLVAIVLMLFITQPWSWTTRLPVQQITCEGSSTLLQIQSGNTCYNIAMEAGVTIEELLRENESLDCNNLRIGSTICVPQM